MVAAAGPGSPAWEHACLVEDILASWSEITPAFVVNRCEAMASNSSKPYQLELIRDLGWSVPDTLITTDPDAARTFWGRHGEVVYKSVSGVRSRISRLRPEHLDRFLDIASCPTQFQQYIAGTDVRVHVVGEEVFACEVVSAADDYRYAIDDDPEVHACSLPQALEDKCRELASALRLPLAGIDLRRTRQDQWFCFEVNPSPAFTYYEGAAGQPIAHSIARLLANAGPITTQGRPELSNAVHQGSGLVGNRVMNP
jgi:glutathione synthase/RimK-type ligase-like ATP-grasp enzyme